MLEFSQGKSIVSVCDDAIMLTHHQGSCLQVRYFKRGTLTRIVMCANIDEATGIIRESFVNPEVIPELPPQHETV